ncbi:GL19720 [Drosophila persimilis]|uniref:GL19720 n=1 Tax=Drosophila persimilis TaxID=7234 RepID=B4HB38_DROPE|nr:GL19720 [Drosophila persimilis]
MPFKCIIECVHKIAHNLIVARPAVTITRGGCRVPAKDGTITNIIFFTAIFWPLYVCLLKDVIILLKDMVKKITRG